MTENGNAIIIRRNQTTSHKSRAHRTASAAAVAC